MNSKCVCQKYFRKKKITKSSEIRLGMILFSTPKAKEIEFPAFTGDSCYLFCGERPNYAYSCDFQSRIKVNQQIFSHTNTTAAA